MSSQLRCSLTSAIVDTGEVSQQVGALSLCLSNLKKKKKGNKLSIIGIGALKIVEHLVLSETLETIVPRNAEAEQAPRAEREAPDLQGGRRR